eukprot:2831094-Pyramimonas_sp.AAC.1
MYVCACMPHATSPPVFLPVSPSSHSDLCPIWYVISLVHGAWATSLVRVTSLACDHLTPPSAPSYDSRPRAQTSTSSRPSSSTRARWATPWRGRGAAIG